VYLYHLRLAGVACVFRPNDFLQLQKKKTIYYCWYASTRNSRYSAPNSITSQFQCFRSFTLFLPEGWEPSVCFLWTVGRSSDLQSVPTLTSLQIQGLYYSSNRSSTRARTWNRIRHLLSRKAKTQGWKGEIYFSYFIKMKHRSLVSLN